VILLAALSVVIATVSPFWGVIFIIAFSGRYQKNRNIFNLVFLGSVVLLFLLRVIDIISVMELLIGVGLTSSVFLWSLNRTLNFVNALVTVFLLNIIYAIAKVIVFGKQYTEIILNVISTYREYLTTSLQSNNEQLNMALEITDKFQELFIKLYPGIWVFSIVIALYIGAVLLSKKGILHWEHSKIRLPYYLIYFLIAALIGIVVKQTQIFGINALIMIAPLFLIQGISVIDFRWGDFFRRSKFLLFLLIISMVFNYFILIFVGLIGLADIWFNFRKIDMEEIDESNLI